MFNNQQKENPAPEECFLFEIDDKMYLIGVMGEFMAGIISFYLIFVFNHFSLDEVLEGRRSYMVFMLGIIIIMRGVIRVPLYVLLGHKKIKFYKDIIFSTHKKRIFKLTDFDEGYLVKYSYIYDKMGERTQWGKKTIFVVVLFGPFLIIPFAVGVFILGLFLKRIVFFVNTLVLMKEKEDQLLSIPLRLISSDDYQKVYNYFLEQRNLNIAQLEERKMTFPRSKKSNLT